MPYIPKYTSVDRVPMSGRGQLNSENSYNSIIKSPRMDEDGNMPEVTEGDILEAIQDGEEYLEEMLNEGREFRRPGRMHDTASAYLATYELLNGLEDPAFARVADISQSKDRGEHLESIQKSAEKYINAIETSGGAEGKAPNRVVSVNTR